jgi:hypothetical protein
MMLTEFDELELKVYREIEQTLRENRDTLLTDIVIEKCNCSSPKTKRAFRCPGAFKINMMLENLDSMRLQRKV